MIVNDCGTAGNEAMPAVSRYELAYNTNVRERRILVKSSSVAVINAKK